MYNEKWILVDKLLGMSFDYKNAYWTFRDEYIEREWKFLERAWEDHLSENGLGLWHIVHRAKPL